MTRVDKRYLLIRVCCILFVISKISLAYGTTQIADVHQEQIKIVTGDSYFPYISDRLPGGGWSQAIVQAVFDSMNYSVDVDSVPWSRGYQWTQKGFYLGTFPYVYTEQRNRDFLFSDPINSVPMRIFVAADSDINDLTSLYKTVLCLPHGYKLDNTSQSFLNEYEIVINRAKDAKACAGQVLKGWSDFGLINGYFAVDEFREKFGGLDKIRVVDEDFGRVTLHFIISRHTANANALMRKFNSALSVLVSNGKKHDIDEKFLGFLN